MTEGCGGEDADHAQVRGLPQVDGHLECGAFIEVTPPHGPGVRALQDLNHCLGGRRNDDADVITEQGPLLAGHDRAGLGDAGHQIDEAGGSAHPGLHEGEQLTRGLTLEVGQPQVSLVVSGAGVHGVDRSGGEHGVLLGRAAGAPTAVPLTRRPVRVDYAQRPGRAWPALWRPVRRCVSGQGGLVTGTGWRWRSQRP